MTKEISHRPGRQRRRDKTKDVPRPFAQATTTFSINSSILTIMVELTAETACVGIVAVGALGLALRAVSNLYKTFLRPAKNLKKYGKWAVITGATGG